MAGCVGLWLRACRWLGQHSATVGAQATLRLDQPGRRHPSRRDYVCDSSGKPDGQQLVGSSISGSFS